MDPSVIGNMIWMEGSRSTRRVHWQYAIVAVFLAGVAIMVLLISTSRSASRFVKDWRYIADLYLDAEASMTGSRGVIGQIARAQNPEYLTEELGLITFGEGTHFTVHNQPGMDYADIITPVMTVYGGNTGQKPLPYPPQILFCVYLEYVNLPDIVVFLGYHKDMYSAEWVVHRGAQVPLSSTFTHLLSRFGCELPSIPE
jgi:hypothetical protein